MDMPGSSSLLSRNGVCYELTCDEDENSTKQLKQNQYYPLLGYRESDVRYPCFRHVIHLLSLFFSKDIKQFSLHKTDQARSVGLPTFIQL
jgi:hypothetical protein